jgi:putative ABC transport system permease protein
MLLTEIQMAIKALLANRTRALLTMFGIVVGISAVATLVAYSAGVEKEMLERYDRWGATRLTAEVAFWQDDVPDDETLTEDDEAVILEQAWTVDKVSLKSEFQGMVTHGINELEDTGIKAIREDYFSIFDRRIETGRTFTDMEDELTEPVCVLGGAIKYELFYNEPAIGKDIFIEGRRFTVVGTLEEEGGRSYWTDDDNVLIPYNSGQYWLDGMWWWTELAMNVKEYKHMPYAEEQVRELLMLNHPRLPVPEEPEDSWDWPIGINSAYDRREERRQAAQALGRFLIVMGALALLIGGVGVMNIMLVSVEERTREIGLRKALGATNGSIMGQFLTEALILTGLGGAVGTLVAVVACRFMQRLPEELKVPEPILSPEMVWAAVGITVGIGVVAGLYPAIHAASLNPIEALRHE